MKRGPVNDRLLGPADSAPEPGGITRRSLALGAAWAVPAVAFAGAAPAFAASMTSGCFVLDWSALGEGTPVHGARPSLTPVDGQPGELFASISIANTVEDGRALQPGAPTSHHLWVCSEDSQRYSERYHGKVGTVAERYQFHGTIPGLTAPGLVLNLSAYGIATVTFAFSQPVSSVTVPTRDLSRNQQLYNERDHSDDRLSFDQPTQVSGDVRQLVDPDAVRPAGYWYHRNIVGANGMLTEFTTVADEPFSTFTLAFRAHGVCGWHHLALENMTVCAAA